MTNTMYRAGRREWLGLATLALPTLLVAVDMNVLGLAVPALSADLRPTGTELLWINDIYGFLIAGFLITMGTLGDRVGRRRLLLIGGAAFAVASVIAAFSTSALMLILARAALGVAGATLMPSTMSLLRNLFHDPVQRTLAISVWMTSFMVGGALGPLVGAVLLEHFWWGSVFLLAVPVMGLLLVFGPILLPENHNPDAGRVDASSVALSLIAMLSTVYGIKKLTESGFGWPAVLALAAGITVGVLFVRRQRTLAEPLLDLRLFGNRVFAAAITLQTLAIFGTVGSMFFISQYLQLVLGLSPLEAGLWTLPSTAAGVLGTLFSPTLSKYVRPAVLMSIGMLVGTAGFVIQMFTGDTTGLVPMVVGLSVLYLGFSPAMTLTPDLIMASAPPERAGAASGISETGGELGAALGVAVLGGIGTAVYRSQMIENSPPGLPADAAASAHDTLGAATIVAGELPGAAGAELLATARAAFTDGLHVNLTISAATAIMLAALSYLLLRHLSAGPRESVGELTESRH